MADGVRELPKSQLEMTQVAKMFRGQETLPVNGIHGSSSDSVHRGLGICGRLESLRRHWLVSL